MDTAMQLTADRTAYDMAVVSLPTNPVAACFGTTFRGVFSAAFAMTYTSTAAYRQVQQNSVFHAISVKCGVSRFCVINNAMMASTPEKPCQLKLNPVHEFVAAYRHLAGAINNRIDSEAGKAVMGFLRTSKPRQMTC